MRTIIVVLMLTLSACGANSMIDSEPFEDFIIDEDSDISVVSLPLNAENILNPDSVVQSYTVGVKGDPGEFDYAVYAINQYFQRPILSQSPFSEADIQITQDKYSDHSGIAYVHAGPACDVVIRPASMDNWKVVAHEILHCLGFGHSDYTESMMYPKAVGGTFTTPMLPVWQDALDKNLKYMEVASDFIPEGEAILILD